MLGLFSSKFDSYAITLVFTAVSSPYGDLRSLNRGNSMGLILGARTSLAISYFQGLVLDIGFCVRYKSLISYAR